MNQYQINTFPVVRITGGDDRDDNGCESRMDQKEVMMTFKDNSGTITTRPLNAKSNNINARKRSLPPLPALKPIVDVSHQSPETIIHDVSGQRKLKRRRLVINPLE